MNKPPLNSHVPPRLSALVRPATASAFTLVELLVVIAIIGIIASLSFSAYSRVQERGKEAGCVSNLRQIAACLNMYAMDNNMHYPPGTVPNPDGAGTIAWSKALGPYLPQRSSSVTAPENQIFVCPAAVYVNASGQRLPLEDISRTYAASAALLGPSASGTLGATGSTPRHVMTIAAPVDTIIVVEGKQSGSSASCGSTYGWSSQISADLAATKPEETRFFDFRHTKNMNVIYGDLSVRSVQLADLKVASMTRNRWLGSE